MARLCCDPGRTRRDDRRRRALSCTPPLFPSSTALAFGVVTALLATFTALPVLAGAPTDGPSAPRLLHPGLVPQTCFAPDTPSRVLENHATRRVWSALTSLQPPAGTRYEFGDFDRWSRTAADGCCSSQGEPITLTWSVVPDGTQLAGFNGEPSAPSDLEAFLDSIYGSESVWLPILDGVFQRWGDLTGIHYVYEPNDDGAGMTFNGLPAGELGVRGDVRLAGHTIDGNSGVLAYNFYPNAGDMVLDTGDSIYTSTGGDSLILRNVLAHEHGHGLGLGHVCPIDRTKLMEPYLTTSFDGPQHDDILAANRGYGDDFEDNDSPGTGSALTLAQGSVALDEISLDDDDDVDYYAFDVGSGGSVTARVAPLGSTYPSGPQNPNGSCSSGTTLDTLGLLDLSLEILGSDGSTVLATSDGQGAGVDELLEDVALSQGAGTYFAVVRGAGGDSPQLYRLELDVADSPSTSQHTLTVQRSGEGQGTVTSSPAGISCGSDCSQTWDEGTVVQLQASPASGSTFEGWSGDADCTDGTVTMNADRSCTATFDVEATTTHTLSVQRTGTGSGTVTSSPAGISCGSDCSQAWDEGTVVQLQASPANGSTFEGWSGDADCTDGTVTMNADRSCTATFDTAPVSGHQLSVSFGGNGQGSIRSSPLGIDCHRSSGGSCTAEFASGTRVTLVPVPDDGHVFDRFRGDSDCSDGVVTMNGQVDCKAFFRREGTGRIFESAFEEGDLTSWSDVVGTP